MIERTTRVFALALGLAVSLAAAEARAEGVLWDRLIGVDAARLSGAQKGQVESILNAVANTYGCRGTLAACVAAGDLTARRHAGFVARMVRKGRTADAIAKEVLLRHESAHPGELAKIDLNDHPFAGDPARAKVVLVEYACFQCPFCAHLALELKKIRARFGDKLVQYYKFFPVRSHDQGVPTALAGIAAMRQGRFWQLYDAMFANRAHLEPDDVRALAGKAGLDVAKWEADRNDPKSMRYLEKDKLEGMRLGVEGTPTFFVNGKLYKGQADPDEIADRIDEELDIVEGRIK